MSLLNQTYRKGVVITRGQLMLWINPHAISGHITRSRRSATAVVEDLANRGWRLPTPAEEAFIAGSIADGTAYLYRRGTHAVTSPDLARTIAGSAFVMKKAKIYVIHL